LIHEVRLGCDAHLMVGSNRVVPEVLRGGLLLALLALRAI
jgi:hypothetical protein